MTDTVHSPFFGDIMIPQDDAPARLQKQSEEQRINRRGRLGKIAERMTLRRAKILELLRAVGENFSHHLKNIEIKTEEAAPPAPHNQTTTKIKAIQHTVCQTATYVLTNKKLIASAMWTQVKDNKVSLIAGMGTGFVTRSIILASFSGTAAAMTAPATLTGAATLMAVGAIVGAASSVAREAFSKKEKTGHWVMNAALKGAAFGAVGGIIGGALREGFSAISALLHTPVIVDAIKPVASTVKDAAQGLTTVAAPPVVPETATPSFRTLATVGEPRDIAPDTPNVCSDAKTFLNMGQQNNVAAIPSPAAPVAPVAEPVQLTAEHAKVLHLPVPMALESIVSQEAFEKLPTAMQREAMAAFQSGNPQSIVHTCKEVSYHLMNEVQDEAAARQGASIAVEGVRRAGEYGLLDSKAGARLSRDVGIMLLNGQNGMEKDISKGIGHLMLSDQQDPMVKKFLSLAATLHPQEFAEAKATLTPEMIEAIKAHAASAPTAPLRTAAATMATPLAPAL